MRPNRNFNNHQASPGGPLLTNHLRDLDIELELLKRKRDIIQQEQDMINRYSAKRQFDYSNTYNRQESSGQQFNTNNYSARYDGPSGSGNFTRPQGPKRQTPNQYWQPPSATKNFTPTQKINPWQTPMPKQNMGFSNQKKFQAPQPRHNNPAQIRPLMSIRPSIGQKVQKNFSNPRKDFKPTKVTKPKPQQAPNKLATYSHDQAKKLISQACDPADKKGEFDQILRADKTPSLQMKGRLELALGMIIKEIKAEHSTDSDDLEYIQSPFIQRMLKHTIRTRIRNVMIDQVVGNVNDIVANYRKKYPKESDIELVQIAKDAQNLGAKTVGVAQLIESDDPEDFYKKNMVKALTTKLEEMLMNLEKLYINKGKGLVERLEKMPGPKTATEKEKKPITNNDNTEYSRTKINFENIITEEENVLEAVNEKLSKVKYYTELMDELIEFRLPKILPKFKDMLLSIMLTDREFLSMKAMITSQIKRKLLKLTGHEELGETSLDLFCENKTTAKIPKATDESTTSKSSAPETNATKTSASIAENKTKSEPKVSLTSETTIQESSVNTFPATASDSSAEKTSTTANDKSTSEPEKTVITPSKVSPTKPVDTASATPTKPATEKNLPTTPKTLASTELYFVKLISRPALPARAVIYDFLNQFNPASIKKHKSISNLLVIGFKNIEDYNKILTVNESVVGNATIIIKASEQVNKPQLSTPSQTEVNENVSKSADQSLADLSLLSADLDNQITDLLTSIRKADEQDRGDSDIKNSDNKMDTSETKDNKSANEESNAKTDKILTSSAKELGTTNTDSKIDNADINKANEEEKNSITSDEKDTLDDANSKDSDGSQTEGEKESKELETITETSDDNKNESEDNKEPTKPNGDKVIENLKESGRATPTRSSSRLASATPSTIRTRRASRLAQNN